MAALSQILPARLFVQGDAVIGHQPLELIAGLFGGWTDIFGMSGRPISRGDIK
jgi:hypothetical protein